MIIAAYAGTGKTTFAAKFENAIDLKSMPYSWILSPDDSDSELEAEKGALYHLRNPLFPDNYIIDILKAEQTCDYVLIPTIGEVVRRLQDDFGRKVLLCYPPDELKEEYKKRFLARGNSDSFLDLFIGQWDRFLQPIRENASGIHIVLRSGEYLADLKERFDMEWNHTQSSGVPDETIFRLEQRQAYLSKRMALYLSGVDQSCVYPISDLSDPEERAFLYQIGRTLYDEIDCRPWIVPLEFFEKNADQWLRTKNHDELRRFISMQMIQEDR